MIHVKSMRLPSVETKSTTKIIQVDICDSDINSPINQNDCQRTTKNISVLRLPEISHPLTCRSASSSRCMIVNLEVTQEKSR